MRSFGAGDSMVLVLVSFGVDRSSKSASVSRGFDVFRGLSVSRGFSTLSLGVTVGSSMPFSSSTFYLLGAAPALRQIALNKKNAHIVSTALLKKAPSSMTSSVFGPLTIGSLWLFELLLG